jgi:hypothetical protein
MALRKETIKKQFADALPAVLEPGEQIEAGTFCVSGPNPLFAQGLFGIIGMLLFGMRWYFVAVTDRRVVFVKASYWTGRPSGFAWADARFSASVSDVNLSAKVWGHFKYTSLTKPSGIRLNVHRWWLDEGNAVADALTSTSGAPSPSDPSAPLAS